MTTEIDTEASDEVATAIATRSEWRTHVAHGLTRGQLVTRTVILAVTIAVPLLSVSIMQDPDLQIANIMPMVRSAFIGEFPVSDKVMLATLLMFAVVALFLAPLAISLHLIRQRINRLKIDIRRARKYAAQVLILKPNMTKTDAVAIARGLILSCLLTASLFAYFAISIGCRVPWFLVPTTTIVVSSASASALSSFVTSIIGEKESIEALTLALPRLGRLLSKGDLLIQCPICQGTKAPRGIARYSSSAAALWFRGLPNRAVERFPMIQRIRSNPIALMSTILMLVLPAFVILGRMSAYGTATVIYLTGSIGILRIAMAPSGNLFDSLFEAPSLRHVLLMIMSLVVVFGIGSNLAILQKLAILGRALSPNHYNENYALVSLVSAEIIVFYLAGSSIMKRRGKVPRWSPATVIIGGGIGVAGFVVSAFDLSWLAGTELILASVFVESLGSNSGDNDRTAGSENKVYTGDGSPITEKLRTENL